MRAIVCREYGPPEALRIEDAPSLEPDRGEVIVAVRASGVNFTDLLATSGRSQLKVRPPFTPGVEMAGVVRSVGDGVTALQPGMRVFGSCFYGSYAEEARFRAEELAPLPASMDFRTGAAFFIASNTSLYALKERARLEPGEALLVLGAGSGAGLAAVAIGKALGGRVTAAASSDEKLALAGRQGADVLFRYQREPLDLDAQKVFCNDLRAQTNGAGYSVIFDGVGGTYSEPALRALARDGRYLSVGFAAGVPSVPLSVALFRNADIMGIELSAPAQREPGRNPQAVATLVEWFEQGKLRPQITAVHSLEHASKALRQLLDRRATGRIVLVTEAGAAA
jgi:NADPH:quinone reductase